MTEEKTETEKEESKKEEKETKDNEVPIFVVNELPTVQTRNGYDNDGKQLNCITTNEAITEMYNDIKEIKKAIVN